MRWLLRIVAGLVLLLLVVLGYTAFRVWQVGREDSRPKSDAVLVLGSAQYNGRPSAVLEARLEHALVLYRAGVAPRIAASGGSQQGDRYTEAEASGTWLHEHGVPSSAIVEVGSGSDTLKELEAVDGVFQSNGWHSVVIVTDPWHSLRARQMARDLGLSAETSPVHSGPAVGSRWTEARYIARETAAYLFYRLFGDATPPKHRPPAF